MKKKQFLTAIIYLIIGEAMLVGMAAFFKQIGTDLPFTVKIFFRNGFGLIALLLFMLLRKEGNLKTKIIHWHFFRAAVGLLGMYGFFYVIDNMKLAEASLVKLTVPLFLPVIAYLWLKEKINRYHISALVIGFVGVGFILQPGTSNFQLVAIVGLFAAAFQAAAKVTIRKMSVTEPYTRVIFYFGLFGTLITLVPAILNWHSPTTSEWPFLILLGVFGTIGQVFITQAYQIASPGKIGVYTYTSLIISALLGWSIWNESLEWYVFVGSAFIILAGFINLAKKKASVFST